MHLGDRYMNYGVIQKYGTVEERERAAIDESPTQEISGYTLAEWLTNDSQEILHNIIFPLNLINLNDILRNY